MHNNADGQMISSEGENIFEQLVTITGLHVRDVITLEKKGKYWRIRTIERETEEFYSKDLIWQEFM